MVQPHLCKKYAERVKLINPRNMYRFALKTIYLLLQPRYSLPLPCSQSQEAGLGQHGWHQELFLHPGFPWDSVNGGALSRDWKVCYPSYLPIVSEDSCVSAPERSQHRPRALSSALCVPVCDHFLSFRSSSSKYNSLASPKLCQCLASSPFIKLTLNYPNLNAPPVSY
jgi:hypothetical protein